MFINKLDYLRLLIIFVAYSKVDSAVKSPCPKYFVFEPDKSEDDRWYGLITLTTSTDINGVSLELQFDKAIIQLGNFLGKVVSNSEHTKFTIKNDKKWIKAGNSLKVEIFVVYDPYYDDPPPQLTKILLNRREICPNYQEYIAGSNSPTILVNINVPKCGTTIAITTGLITEGQHTQPGQWPWHAALYFMDDGKKDYKCGGTLITERHVLTAAHCTADKITNQPRDPQKTLIILGKYGIFTFGKYEQEMKISKIIVHPGFNRTSFFNDISIITLIEPVKITDYVRPICLWEEDTSLQSVVNRVGTAVGWGRDHNDNDVTDLLMQAQMPIVDTLKCIYANRQFYSLFTNDANFCAGYGNGTSVCNGDSGGGLVFPKKGTSGVNAVWQIRGIVSNTVAKDGFVCDPSYYVIFTDVAKYLEWIQETVK